jgi:hypothetical protein
MKRFRGLISVLVAGALLATACGDSNGDDAAPTQTGTRAGRRGCDDRAQPVAGGKLSVLITSETAGWIPSP